MTRRRTTSKCHVNGHILGAGRRCVACGKAYQTPARTNRKPTLQEATAQRMAEFAALAESGITEMTGRLRREYTSEDPMERGGDVVGRFGGLKPAYPELMAISAGPKQIAQAIRRGKGRTFETVQQLMAAQMHKEGFEPARRRSPGRPTVAPHQSLTTRCKHCNGLHTTSQHRFHGKGALHRTHLWAFPTKPNSPRRPAPKIKPQRIGRTQRVFYLRDQGKRQGPYVHKFTRRAAGLWTHAPGWYYFDKNVAVIR